MINVKASIQDQKNNDRLRKMFIEDMHNEIMSAGQVHLMEVSDKELGSFFDSCEASEDESKFSVAWWRFLKKFK